MALVANRQLSLFPKEKSSDKKSNGTSFCDPSFVLNKSVPMHRWVPWIAGFSGGFVRDVLLRYLGTKGVVLDPFAGVGTTLLEATLQGHDVIGFEINPYAALACQTKMNAHNVALDKFEDSIEQFSIFYKEKTTSSYKPISKPPEGFKTRHEFFSPKVLRKVLIIKDFINSVPDVLIRDLFRLAFGATLVSYSNYSYEPSLGRRSSVGKPEVIDFTVGETMLLKLREMEEDIYWLGTQLKDKSSSVNIINNSFFNYESYLKQKSVDLVITSPPYLNNYHYNRNTRPHLYWLDYTKKPSDFQMLEKSNFGKYWQTVRELEGVELEFSLPDVDLEDRIKKLAKLNPEKGMYGGHGWANYAASYFNDCRRFALGLDFVLKPGGTALVVIGNSILQGMMIRTDEYFGKIAESVGLELVAIEVPRKARTGNSIIQSDVRVTKTKISHQLYEAIVELKKPHL
ncbi:MAG: hypothetical protein JXA51_03340 [Dehalococcoidales bacterium]|nr:hypothetical protein [Dehalococcoidales bacterium]